MRSVDSLLRRGACAHAHGDADFVGRCNCRCRAFARCRSSPPRRSIASRCAPSSRPFDPRRRCARRCYGSAIAAARASTYARASRISPSKSGSSTRTCPRRTSRSRHGQMPPTVLEDVMSAFYDGKYDVLLSTAIVEVGPRHSDRQHADRAPRRHASGSPSSTSCAGGSAAPRRAPIALLTTAGQPQDHAAGGAPAQGAAVARHAGRRLPARLARPRHPRRRQPPGRGAVRPHQGGRGRALPADCWRRRCPS